MAISNKDISFKLSLEDAEKVKATLASLGETGEKALSRIDKAQRANATSFKVMNDLTSAARSKVEDLSGSLGAAGKAMSRFGTAGLAAGAALGGFLLVQRSAINAFMESEQSIRRFEAALEATGNRTGMTKRQLDDMTDSLSRALKIDDDDIRQAMATVVTFGNVSGDSFRKVIELSADLSATWGGDLSSNAAKISEMLDRLASGSADGLRKAFVELNQEQIAFISNLATGGKTVEAQEALLKALQDRIGGQAEADSRTLTGTVRGLRNAWDDFLKSLAATQTYSRFLSTLTGTVEGLTSAVNRLRGVQAESLVEQVSTSVHFAGDHESGLPQKFSFDGASSTSLDSSVFKSSADIASHNRSVALYLEMEERAAAQRQRLAQMSARSKAIETQVEEAKQRAQQQGLVLTETEIAQVRELAARTVDLEEAHKKSTVAAGQQQKAHAELLETLAQEEERAGRLLKAYGSGAAAVAAETRQLEAEQRVRQAGIALDSREGRALTNRINRMLEQEDAIKATSEAQKEALRQQEQYAKEQETLLQEPFKNAIAGVQGAFSSAFENIFTGGVQSFKDLGSTVRGVFVKLAAEMATLLVFNPRLVLGASATLGGMLGGSSGAAASSSGGGSATSSLMSLGNIFNGGLESSFLGNIGTSIYTGLGGQSIGGLTTAYSMGANLPYGMIGGGLASLMGLGGSGIGGSIGGTIGGLAGGAFGPLGAIAGSFLGTALGGLFGNSKPTNAAAFGSLDLNAGTSTYSHMNKGNSAENMSVLQTAFDGVLAFSKAFNTLGVGTIKGKITGIDAGVRDEQSAYVNGTKVTAAAGQFGQLAISALKTALKQTSISNSDVKTALGKVDFSDTGKAFSDVQFAAGFKESVAAYKRGLSEETTIRTQATAAGKEFTDGLITFRDTAKRLGLSTAEATDGIGSALARLHNAVRDKPMSEVEQSILAITTQIQQVKPLLLQYASEAWADAWIKDAINNNVGVLRGDFEKGLSLSTMQINDPQRYALTQLDQEFAGIRKDAAALGADLGKVEAYYGARRKQIIEQYASEATNGLNSVLINSGKQIRQWLDNQLLGGSSTLSPSAKLAAAQSQFGATLTLARKGDAEALGLITGKSDALLDAARSVYASSGDYAVIEKMVRSTLEGLGKGLNLPGFASGTASAPPGMALVGERGPELVRLRGGERIYPANESQRMLSGRDDGAVAAGLRTVSRVTAQGTLALVEEVRGLRAEMADVKTTLRLVMAR